MNDYIPIAAFNQYSYCPHRCWWMFCLDEFVDNQYTVEGTSLHERVHTLGEGQREEAWQVRAVWLKSERYCQLATPLKQMDIQISGDAFKLICHR